MVLLLPTQLCALEAAGKTILARGDVKANNDDKTRKLKRRSPIYDVDTVITGANSRAQLRMSDGGMLALQENTHLEISKYEYDAEKNKGSAVMNLISGGIRTVTGKLKSENGDYKLETPVGSIGIRGTHYEIEIINGELFIAVWDGAIDISVEVGGSEQQVSLGDNEDFAYAKIDESGEVTELLEPPENFNEGHSSAHNDNENDEEDEGSEEEEQTADTESAENENDSEQSESQTANTEENTEENETEEQTAGNEENTEESEAEEQTAGGEETGDNSNEDETQTADNQNNDSGDDPLDEPDNENEEPNIANNDDTDPLDDTSGNESPDENPEVANTEEENKQDEEILEIITLGEKTEIVIVDADSDGDKDDVFSEEDEKILEDASKENTLDDVSTTDDVFSFIENRTGTATFSLDENDIANQNINSMSMSVNFTTRVISDGELLLGTENDLWVAVFDGKFDSSEIDMDINAASHNDIKADGDISGTFTNKGENITGQFELWEEQNRDINTKGTYVLGENK
ncbi:FecR family protein [Algibacillus agarilyticus]|uniref:FecR family protein n=1 Tax=Algibacillus agarilyticus TaxID=2234133 RepID=UPI001300B22C|nr:FecR family protein [Algibacillus agarilyticus]